MARHAALARNHKAQKELGTAALVQVAKETSLCELESKKNHFTQLAPSWHFPACQRLEEAEDYFS